MSDQAEPPPPSGVEPTTAKAAPTRVVAKAVPRKPAAAPKPEEPAVLRTVAKGHGPRGEDDAAAPKRAPAKRPVVKATVKSKVVKKTARPAEPAPEGEAGEATGPKQTAEANRDALMRQALTAHSDGRLDDAVASYRKVLLAEPDFAPAWINLGVLQRRRGAYDAAVICLKRGIALKPDDGPAWSNLGNALRAVNRLEEALAAQRRALDLSPDLPRIHYNYGLTIRDAGDLKESENALRRAQLLGHDKPELRWDQSLTHLLKGDLKKGFEAYENRWGLEDVPRLHTQIPAWTGEPLEGRRLLVWAEQGLGDTIQFCRYLTGREDDAILDPRRDDLVLEVQQPLARLLRNSPDFARVKIVERGRSLPEVDLQIPLLSLPYCFGTDLKSIPDHCPYLIAPAKTGHSVPPRQNRLKVGIAWAGKPSHKNDRNRSIDLCQFAPLFDLPNVDFHSLQKGDATADIDEKGLGAIIRDRGATFRDFADTAAVVRDMDLIISIDTSVAHLAGAMARPVWTLLPYAPDWRWMMRRDDSPWYPSMTLFRQTSPGDWGEVFSRLRHALIRKLKTLR